ncbi:hypothetical protein GCM10012275_33900 [Longimycelium tulufanense]|uniref:Uncharacterized protein n=1 Tax=Longimycelium tulufanense TaxID=907463 RepID=A0A8J3CCQ9_9PSEU|nr:hypothetical protein GCM10012275_33900 [Longimycelium tulufanense]
MVVLRPGRTVPCWPAGEAGRRAVLAAGFPVVDLPTALCRVGIAVSLGPPAGVETVARRIATHGFAGICVDAGPPSPGRARLLAAMLSAAGATVVDAAVIGLLAEGLGTARLFLSGPRLAVRSVARLVDGSRVERARLGEQLGWAGVLLMAFASYETASRALAAAVQALADRHGVTEALLTEALRLPSSLADPDCRPTLAKRAWQSAPEMYEVARTLDAPALPTVLAPATAGVLAVWDTGPAWHTGDARVAGPRRDDTVLRPAPPLEGG